MLTGELEEVEAPIGSVNCAEAAAEKMNPVAEVKIQTPSDLCHGFRKQSSPTFAL